MAGGLVRFGQRFRQQARQALADSRERVHQNAYQRSPVLTGRMRSLIRDQETSERHSFSFFTATPGLGYIVFLTAEDFREHGQIFYPWLVIAGYDRRTKAGVIHVAGRDFLSPSLEEERVPLLESLQTAAFRAARGA